MPDPVLEQTGQVDTTSTPDSTTQDAGIVAGAQSVEPPAGATTQTSELDGLDLLNQQATEPEHEEVEYDGQRYNIPRALKDAFLRHSDYTRKTQEVSQQRAAHETREREFQQNVEVHKQYLDDFADLRAIDKRLELLSRVDWATLNQQNPQQAQALHLEFTQLQAHKGQLVGTLTQKQQQMQANQQRELARLAADAEAVLRRDIKDWSPEKDKQLANYARANGIDPQLMGQVVLRNPGFMVALDKAAKFDQLLKERSIKRPPAPHPQPGTRMQGGGSSATKKLSDMTTQELQQWRRERKSGNR